MPHSGFFQVPVLTVWESGGGGGEEVSMSNSASFNLEAPGGLGLGNVHSSPRAPAALPLLQEARPAQQAMHSPQVGFLHREAVLVDARGGHTAAQHILGGGDVALLGDALQVRQVAGEQGALSLALQASLASQTHHPGPSEDPARGEPSKRAQDPWGLQVAQEQQPEAMGALGEAASPLKQRDPKDDVTSGTAALP